MMGKVELWDLGAGRLITAWTLGTDQVTAVAFSPDESLLATSDMGGMVRILNLGTGAEVSAFKSRNGVGDLAFSRDGKLLAAGHYGGAEISVWNCATLKKVLSLPVPANQIAFAPDGHSLVTCSTGGNEARIWEFPSGRFIAALKGHVGGMTQVAYSPDGKTLATGAYDGRIKLWNIATLQEVATLPHRGTINALRFSPDGNTLAASFWSFPRIGAQLFRAPSLAEIQKSERRKGAN